MVHAHYIETCSPAIVVGVAVHEADAVPPPPPYGHAAEPDVTPDAAAPVAAAVPPAFFSKPVTNVSIINFIVSL